MKTIIIDGIEYNLTPKVLFKKGDFVVIQETTYLISKIEGLNVTLSCNGRDCLFDIDVLKNARLWDITKDAKKGDVLVHNGCTFIFMGIENGIVQAFEENLLYGNKTCNFGEPDKDNDYSPASKERQDLLFQKMKEAGYEWNAEKKELKEIEYEPNKCEGCNNVKGCIACVDGSEWAHIEERKPTEWNEGDESNFQGIIDELKANKHHAPDSDLLTYDRFLSWFKSLKERYVWKPNDEQMEALDWALSLAKNCGNECAFELRTLREQLKKLKG